MKELISDYPINTYVVLELMKRKAFTSNDGEQKMKQTKLIRFLAQTIKTPVIPMPPTDDSCVLPVRSEDIETATTVVTTDVRLMHEEDDPLRASSSHQLPDDAVVQGGPEEGPADLDCILGSDSDILISLGAKPHQPLFLNVYSHK